MKESVEQFLAAESTPKTYKKPVEAVALSTVVNNSKMEGVESSTCTNAPVVPSKANKSRKKSTKKLSKTKIPKLVLRWLVNKTKVATFCGDNPRFPGLHSTSSGWISGILVKVTDDEQLPYHVQWKTATPYVTCISEEEINEQYNTYVQCDDKVLLTQWLAGREFLWRSVKKGNTESVLRCGTVMFYDRLLDNYRLLYRDGEEAFVSGDEIDACAQNNNNYTLAEKYNSSKEPWSSVALSKINSYGVYRARNVPPKPNRRKERGAS
jgi:hypothetical protein